MNYVDVSFMLAFAAEARSLAPDEWFLVRRPLGAGVPLTTLAQAEQQPFSPAHGRAASVVEESRP